MQLARTREGAVKHRREQLGISQAELVRRSGVRQSAISMAESTVPGRFQSLGLTSSIRVARALGCSVEDITELPDDEAAVSA